MLGSAQLNVQAPEVFIPFDVEPFLEASQISFTVWARFEAGFTDGYIVRKRLVPAGPGSQLVCLVCCQSFTFEE